MEILGQDLWKKIQNGENPFILDIREPFEVTETGKIPNSILLPMGDISEESLHNAGITRETEFYLICRSGNRTWYACEALRSAGYQNVWSVKGGIQEWMLAGRELEK